MRFGRSKGECLHQAAATVEVERRRNVLYIDRRASKTRPRKERLYDSREIFPNWKLHHRQRRTQRQKESRGEMDVYRYIKYDESR